MKIGVQAWGTEGDIRPLMALARGLSLAGHEVTFAVTDVTGADPAKLVEEKTRVTVRHVARSKLTPDNFRQAANEIPTRTRNPTKQIALIIDTFFTPYVSEIFDAAKTLCQENELVVGHFLVYPLTLAAQQLGRPRVAVFTAPVHPSREYVPAGAPRLGQWFTPLIWKLGSSMVKRFFRPPIASLYTSENQPPPQRVIEDAWASRLLNLVAVSPAIFPRPTDWEAHTQVCGFLEIPAKTTNWCMPESLRQFLEEGPPPVFMTFGSMTVGEADPNEVPQLLAQAAHLTGCRAIIQADWENVTNVSENKSIYRITRVPHDAIFPHCAAVVHHGGAGTTHAATRAGCPSVIVAHVADQLFWAGAMRRAGIGGKPLKRTSLSAKKLASALKRLLVQDGVKAKAEQLGQRMHEEDGIRQALALIEKVPSQSSTTKI